MSQLDEIQVLPRVADIVALPGIGTDGGTAPSYEVISVRYEYTQPSTVDPLSLSSVIVSVKRSNREGKMEIPVKDKQQPSGGRGCMSSNVRRETARD